MCHVCSCENSGTTSSCGGTRMPAIISRKSGVRKGKRSCEKAYAAMLAVSTVSTVTIVEVMKLLMYHWMMSPASSTCRNELSDGFEVHQVTGTFVVSASGLSAVSMAHRRGSSQMMAKTR